MTSSMYLIQQAELNKGIEYLVFIWVLNIHVHQYKVREMTVNNMDE